MTLIMGRREPDVLARALRSRVAMQLTNICRDGVGEDAGNGRIYLQLACPAGGGVSPMDLPAMTGGVRRPCAA